MNYLYKAFGLCINSEIELPELLPGEGLSDVEISYGETPRHLQNCLGRGVNFQASKNEFLFYIDHIGRYYLTSGTKILIEPAKNASNNEIRLFLFGSVFGALFIQRGLLPIHGSAIKSGTFASIFSGTSGAGKSSLAGQFLKDGYSILSDDISVVNSALMVESAYPKLKLWKDVLDKLELTNGIHETIRPCIQKFHFPIEKGFYSSPLKLKNVVVIQTKNSSGFNIEELKGIQKFNVLKNNIYRYRFTEGLMKFKEQFMLLQEVLGEINVYAIKRPSGPLLIEELARYIQSELKLDDK